MKEIKKVNHILKQYFVFSRNERRGIYALLVIIALLLVAPKIWVFLFPPQTFKVNIITLPDDDTKLQSNVVQSNIVEATLFNFNPNTADSVSLVMLGFLPKTARSIVSYRNKGGRFKTANDLYKIYNVDSGLIAKLIPYVEISNNENNYEQQTQTPYKPKQVNAFVPVEINTADSLALVKLYGVGPYMASKIITYRNRSGGFFSLQQLTEVYGIDESLLDELQGKIYVDASHVRYININTVSYDELKQHPYLRYKMANAIVNYRKQHGSFKQVEDLKQVLLLPDSTYNKLLPYIKLN